MDEEKWWCVCGDDDDAQYYYGISLQVQCCSGFNTALAAYLFP